MASSFDFVNVVVADRDLLVTTAHDHACRVAPKDAGPGAHSDLGRLVKTFARLLGGTAKDRAGDGVEECTPTRIPLG